MHMNYLYDSVVVADISLVLTRSYKHIDGAPRQAVCDPAGLTLSSVQCLLLCHNFDFSP